MLFFKKICKDCFYEVFEEEIHRVIVDNQLFKSGERIAIGASGGKGNISAQEIKSRHLCSLIMVTEGSNPSLRFYLHISVFP